MMFGWFCNFGLINHHHIHIAGNVWQCHRCKVCSMGQDLHAKHGIGMQHGAPMGAIASLDDFRAVNARPASGPRDLAMKIPAVKPENGDGR